MSQKDEYVRFLLSEVPRVVEFVEMAEWWLLGAGGSQCFMGAEVKICGADGGYGRPAV